MNSNLLYGLIVCETDIEGALRRFCGDEALYISCLHAFLQDPTINQLQQAIDAQAWDDAFTAAHALKGLAGNMGFVPLFHAVAELVVLIRAGKVGEIGESFRRVRRSFDEVSGVIRNSDGAAL